MTYDEPRELLEQVPAERMRKSLAPRLIDRLLRRVPADPVVGVIWRWDHTEPLTLREAEYWELHALPWGWSIIRDERRRS